MTADAEGDDVTIRIRGPVATIIVDRQGTRNAFRLATWQALSSLISVAESDRDVRLILVRGAGGHFSAGNDISELNALRGNPTAAEVYAGAMAVAMQSIEEVSKPVLMAVEGVCYGGALALTLAGDLRIAADNAVFAITPARLGALYLESDLYRLVAAVGVGQAKKLIYSAEPVAAAQAERIGLVDEVIPADRFEQHIKGLIDVILHGSSFTLRRTKEMLRALGHGRAPCETSETLAFFVEATQSEDFREGVSAFLGKRSPRFH